MLTVIGIAMHHVVYIDMHRSGIGIRIAIVIVNCICIGMRMYMLYL